MRHIYQPTVQKYIQPKHVQFERADIEWALTQMDGVIDVSEEDLVEIYELAIRHVRNGYNNVRS